MCCCKFTFWDRSVLSTVKEREFKPQYIINDVISSTYFHELRAKEIKWIYCYNIYSKT